MKTPSEIIEEVLRANPPCGLICEKGEPCPHNLVRIGDQFCKAKP